MAMNSLSGKSVLVTGGTGSFGRYVVHRLLSEDVKEIRIFSRDEKKQFDMRHKFGSNEKIRFFLGDVRNYNSVREVVSGVNVVFHAAALKQVPHCEQFPMEAVETNVIGAKNVIDASLDEELERVVCISTDKAVQPVNVMGMTKGLQEKILTVANTSPRNKGTLFMGVRYGNVLNSRGSVVPFFRELIRKKKTLTITSNEMTRFLLTLKEAVELVIYACENGKGGEIFVKRAKSATIMDIGKAVSEIAGVEFEHEIIGRFPGEKLHEILVSEEEKTRCEDRGDYILIHPWRQSIKAEAVGPEFSSADVLVDLEETKRMITESDNDANDVDFEEGIFSR